jgi:GrpB-like predicted nucleotidyltransferase (UPF0157 family)/predicted transcriptional regulator YdeE
MQNYSYQNPKIELIGNQKTFASDQNAAELLTFYGELFGRLKREVKHTGTLSRYVSYQSPVNESRHTHFLGLEVDKIAQIPKNMIAWKLNQNTKTVWRPHGDRNTIILEEKIRWRWLEQSHQGPKRWVGEYISASKTPFWISGNAYGDQNKNNSGMDAVELIAYDPSWPEQFKAFASWLKNFLGSDLIGRVVHFGSTAIVGMPAKPIIDVLVEIPSFVEAKRGIIPRLNCKVWEYWWYQKHMIFIKRKNLMGQRTHHVHMAPKGDEIWNRLAFRDYLRSHPDDALRYADLKRRLAEKYRTDREMYTQAKTEFIKEITSKAL